MITMLLSLSLLTAPPEASFEERCAREVHELHTFFQQWFEGSLSNTDEAFARFADVMADDFVIVSPSGQASPRAPLLEALRGAYGSQDFGSGDGVWVEDVKIAASEGALAVVTYIERQKVDGQPRDRRSTAVLRELPGTPNGVVWVYLQETWLPKDQQGQSTRDDSAAPDSQ